MSIAVPALTAAYLLTSDQKYSRRAVNHLVAWFVDENTRMNPSLLYSQAIHGLCTGRSYGLIDSLHLVEVSKAISILNARSQLRPTDSTGIYDWFTQFLKWMTTHPYGITEGKAKNNHATCYWLQVASFATLVGAGEQFNESRRRFKEQLLPQMAPDGSFPQELHRTKPFGYSLFNLDQMTSLCHVISADDQNFWNFAITSGQTLHQAAEYMYPYAKDKSTWPFKPDVMYFVMGAQNRPIEGAPKPAILRHRRLGYRPWLSAVAASQWWDGQSTQDGGSTSNFGTCAAAGPIGTSPANSAFTGRPLDATSGCRAAILRRPDRIQNRPARPSARRCSPQAARRCSPQAARRCSPQAARRCSPQAARRCSPQAARRCSPQAARRCSPQAARRCSPQAARRARHRVIRRAHRVGQYGIALA